jgi:excisionase family DNA binding protein
MSNPFEVIDKRLSLIETLLLEIKHGELKPIEPAPEGDSWLDLTELCQYHPDKPKQATVYEWVSKAKIPFHKSGKKLRFLKSEIDSWLRQGRNKTLAETAIAAEQYISKNRR